ncbi:MAG: nitrate/nitrite transporter NrtS [Rubrobacteraceae bacterium]|nr:nitrate/nitrite transporter NrtS [Rubrobacteraceae bacterium]MCL6437999.1 nitrate/nitrite transporter NrtS [Rubrobacteraceae bacterium]
MRWFLTEARRFLRICLHPSHLRRTGAIALIVGTWLTLFNQGDVLWSGDLGGGLWVKVLLNYLTPFVVSNLGLLSRKPEKGKSEDGRALPENHSDRASRDIPQPGRRR